MLLRPHIAAETLGVVPPRHHLEDARPGDIPPGFQPLKTWCFFDQAETLPERALQSLRALRRDSNLTTHDEATAAVLAGHAAVRCHWPIIVGGRKYIVAANLYSCLADHTRSIANPEIK